MKLLSSLIIFAMTAMAADSANALPVEISGQFRLRAEGNAFTDLATDRDFFTVRLRPRFNLKTEAYELVFTPQFAKTLGVTTGTSGTTTDSALGVHEAYGTYPLIHGVLRLSGGRMILSYGDELVVGALEWNNVGRSFDGFRARFTHDTTWVDFFATKVNENNAAAPTAPDQDFMGIYSHFESVPALQGVDLYSFYQKSPVAAKDTQLYVVGARTSGRHDQFDHRIEGTLETGDGTLSPTSPFQVDAELGIRLPGSLDPRLAVGGFIAGQGYHSLYPTAHKWLGSADVVGRRNLKGLRASAEAHVTSNWVIKSEYHHFERFDSNSDIFKTDGVTKLGNSASSSSKSIGSEIDFTLTHAMDSSTTLSGGGALFFEGQYLQDQFASRTPVFYYVQLETKF
jgi:hypothetical protein